MFFWVLLLSVVFWVSLSRVRKRISSFEDTIAEQRRMIEALETRTRVLAAALKEPRPPAAAPPAAATPPVPTVVSPPVHIAAPPPERVAPVPPPAARPLPPP